MYLLLKVSDGEVVGVSEKMINLFLLGKFLQVVHEMGAIALHSCER